MGGPSSSPPFECRGFTHQPTHVRRPPTFLRRRREAIAFTFYYLSWAGGVTPPPPPPPPSKGESQRRDDELCTLPPSFSFEAQNQTWSVLYVCIVRKRGRFSKFSHENHEYFKTFFGKPPLNFICIISHFTNCRFPPSQRHAFLSYDFLPLLFTGEGQKKSWHSRTNLGLPSAKGPCLFYA